MSMQSLRAIAAGVSVAAMVTGSAQGGAFALKERSARAQGLSFAGATAGSGGLQSMGFNPAAIGLVEDLELSGGLSFIQPIAEGTVTSGPNAGQTVEADRFAGVANQYVGYRIDPEFLVGLAIYTPFGLATQYDATDAAAVDAVTSRLRTLVVAPHVAWQPVPELTLAGSANITYVNARLTSNSQILSGSTTTLSFGLGALWQATPSTTIGVAYQHGYNLNINGFLETAAFTVPASADTSLPATVSFGIVQGITDDLRIMGEFQWQNWSVFDQIDVQAPALGLLATDPQNYDDAFFVAGGAEYDVNDAFTLRLGAAWDQTPTNSGILPGTPAVLGITNRTARVPDEDRIWLSIGGTYNVTDHMSIDAGYSYLFTIEDPVVGLRAAPQTGSQIVFDGGAHIFSIGGSVKF